MVNDASHPSPAEEKDDEKPRDPVERSDESEPLSRPLESERLQQAKAALHQQYLQEDIARRQQQRQLLIAEAMKRRDNIERVRQLAYGPFTPEDLLRPGGVEDAYMKVQINERSIGHLRQGDDDAFSAATKKGFFVFGFREKPGSASGEIGLSVHEQMLKDLSRQPNAEGVFEEGEYIGRCLKDASGRIVSYLTCELPPRDPRLREIDAANIPKNKSEYWTKLCFLLDKGITDGGMEYMGITFDDFMSHIDLTRTANFDTICSDPDAPLAASRLFALLMEEIGRSDPEVKYMVLYRLLRLRLDPPPHPDVFQIEVGENDSSNTFFRKRKFGNLATEFNADGFYSTRIVHGQEHKLLPAWIWMAASLPQAQRHSMRLWTDALREYQMVDPRLPEHILQLQNGGGDLSKVGP